MATPFNILRLRLGSEQGPQTDLQGIGQEPLGSKRKLWGLLDTDPDAPWLFKYARANTGEHWSEKLAAELAVMLGLPAARVELATVDGQHGAILRSILPYDRGEGTEPPVLRGELVHGNEILAGRLPEYEKSRQWRQEDHSWENIVTALKASLSPGEVDDSLTRLAGMVVLDAWIGNQDRHHENWAVLIDRDGTKRLAPSYDHASSLGRELLDPRRETLLQNRRVPQYVDKGHGAIYGQLRGKHADNPLDLTVWAAERHPDWFHPWIDRLREISPSELAGLVERIPDEVMSSTSRKFTVAFLIYTLDRLQNLTL
jgi:hypothetical protein